jgi:hypothetical protein
VSATEEVDPVRWSARLAAALDDAARRVARIAAQLADDWPDATGRAWAERATRLGRELHRDAVAADELRAELTRTAEPAPAEVPRLPPGVRLGGTSGVRVDEERGMRIAELGDDGSPAPR